MATTFAEYLKSLNLQTGETLEQVASFRPTFYIGLGGFGCSVLRSLKDHIQQELPEHAEGFAFLGLDTHPLPPNDKLTRNEYVGLSVGVAPLTAAKNHPRYLSWFPKLCGAFAPRNISAGADRVKAVGRLAFRNPPVFEEFITKLTTQANRLRQPRSNFIQGAPMKVYVISTLAGGTGSGCLLDVLVTIGKLFQETEAADFPYQAIIATPDVLLGEVNMGELRELYSNTYASLKEIHHFMASDAAQTEDYDAEAYAGLTVSRHYLPQLMHLIGDKNEAGSAIVTEIGHLAEVVVAYLLSEIQTPMRVGGGQPKVQDLENVFLGQPGLDEMPRSFASFGVVRTGVPADVLGHFFSLRLALAALRAETARPATISADAANWVAAKKLTEAGNDDLQGKIREPIADSLKVAVDPHSVLLKRGTKLDDLAERAQLFADKMQSELSASKKVLIEKRGDEISTDVAQALSEHFQGLLTATTLGGSCAFLDAIAGTIQTHQTALSEETTGAKARLKENLDKDLKLSMDNLRAAAQGNMFGRKGRVQRGLDDFQLRLEALLEGYLDLWVKERGMKIYAGLLQDIGKLQKKWNPCFETLSGHLKQSELYLQNTRLRLDQMADVQRREPGNRFSLIDAEKADELYQDFLAASEAGAVRRIRDEWIAANRVEDTKSNTEKWLNGACGTILSKEVRPVLDQVTLNKILKRFYETPEKQSLLFRDLQTLSSPMFWLDPNRREPNYTSYWILAIHPGQKPDFDAGYSQYLPGEGIVYAFFESPHEVVLYQLKMGYTIHSHRSITQYESVYERMQHQYQQGLAKRKPVRPVHGWLEAETWEPLLPRKDEQEALTWFVLGRAFSGIYPLVAPQGGKAKAKGCYVYASGSNYYLALNDIEKPIALGNGLSEAVEKFAARSDWRGLLRDKIEAKIEGEGLQTVRAKLEEQFVPTLTDEIATAEKQRDQERAELLRRLAIALQTYIRQNLTTSGV